MLKSRAKKSISTLLLMMLMVTAMLSGCGSSETTSSTSSGSSDGKKMVIGYATKSSTAPYWVILNEGAKKAAEDLGVELVMLGPAKENDITGQLQVIEDLISRKVNGLVVAAADSVGVGPAVEKAQKNSIPVIAVDTTIEGADVDSFVATDNIKAAEQAAEFMGKKLNGKGNIVLLNGMIAQGTGKERYEGFKNYLEKNYPEMKIVSSTDTGWQDENALKAMEDAIRANEQIDGVFVGWDGAALAAHTALKEAGRLDKTTIVGFDCYPQALKYMKEGTIAADIAQYPYKMGYEAVQAAVKKAKGDSIEKRIDTGTLLVNNDNVDQYIQDNNVKID